MADAPLDFDDVTRDLERGLKLITDKANAYRLRKAYYEGNAAEFTSSPVIASLLAKSAEAHPVTFANVPVDALADKIELASVTAEGSGAERLAATLDENDFEDEADDWHRKAAYLGDYYAIIDPQTETEAGLAVEVKLVGSSPFTTVVVYSSKDNRTKLYGVKRWRVGKTWHAHLFYDDVTVALATDDAQSETEPPKAAMFHPVLDDEGTEGSERIPHAGGRMLVAHYAVDSRPYGTPVHAKAFGPQDAITKISATNLANVDGQGFASRWALQDPLSEIDDDIDDDFGTDGPATPSGESDGMTKPTTGSSRVRTVPGAIAILKGIKQVGQFDTTESAQFLANLDWYVRAMAVATGTPMFEFDMGGEQPSGESRRRASGRINKHARKVKRALGRGHKDLADTVLATMGIEAPVAVNWLPTETETDAEGLELVALKIKNGVPITVALLEAGYLDEQVAEWFPKGDPHLTPDMLATVAPALQALGAAATLGVITSREVADALPWLLTGPRDEGGEPVTPPPAEPEPAA